MAVYQNEDTVQLIKETANIADVIGEHVTLRRAGANLKGLCPFHPEKTPSFTVNPDRKTYHCFGCGEGGDVISFMMQFHRLNFAEALKELARKYHIALPEKPLSPQELDRARKREALHAANEKAAEIFHRFLLSDPAAAKARNYLEERGITREVVEEFRLGFAPESWDYLGSNLEQNAIAPDAAREAGLLVPKEKSGHYDRFRNRVMFPIFGLTGRIVGFGGRILGEGQPKYLNSPESAVFDKGRTLFGIYQNRDHVRQARSCIVVEGNFDLLSLVVHGVRNVAAPLGTALTQAHVRSLKGYCDEVILLFDGDQAGTKAAMRSVPLFLTEQVSAKIALLPESHDPDTYIRTSGKEGLLALLAAALPLPEFMFDTLVARHGLTVDGKSKIVSDLREMIKTIDDPLQQTLFVAHFSKKLGLTSRQLQEGILPAPPRPSAPRQAPLRQAGGSETMPLKQRQLLEFLTIYPEYLQAFLEAGMEEIVVTEAGLNILALLKKLTDAQGGPEQLLDLARGPERAFVSRLLIDAPSHTDAMKEEMAAEMLAWLRQSSIKAKKERLIQQINEAHQTRNEELWLELMTRKKEMDEAMHS